MIVVVKGWYMIPRRQRRNLRWRTNGSPWRGSQALALSALEQRIDIISFLPISSAVSLVTPNAGCAVETTKPPKVQTRQSSNSVRNRHSKLQKRSHYEYDARQFNALFCHFVASAPLKVDGPKADNLLSPPMHDHSSNISSTNFKQHAVPEVVTQTNSF